MKSFTYGKSLRVINWGCGFDSVLELKFALSIQQDYEYLRSHIPIYYDPRTRMPTNYIRDNIRRYTPDFLIRHKQTNQATLVEIQPRAFEHHDQLILRKEVAENYIRWRKFDWVFRVIYDDEIHLTASQRQEVQQCIDKRGRSKSKFRLQQLNNRYDQSQRSLFTKAPSNSIVQFVMFGHSK